MERKQFFFSLLPFLFFFLPDLKLESSFYLSLAKIESHLGLFSPPSLP